VANSRNRLTTIVCLAAMTAGLVIAAAAHPGMRARLRGITGRASSRIDVAAVDEPLLAAAIADEDVRPGSP
jgi:hypothetical protein